MDGRVAPLLTSLVAVCSLEDMDNNELGLLPIGTVITVKGSTVQRKILDIYPDGRYSLSSPLNGKGGSTSTKWGNVTIA